MATHMEGPVVLALTAGGLMAGGHAGGPLDFPLADFGWATVFAAIGVVGRATLDAKDARDHARSEHRAPDEFDFVSLALAIFAAPLIGGIALAISRAAGFLPDYMAAPVIMGMGYWGRDGVSVTLDVIRGLLARGKQ